MFYWINKRLILITRNSLSKNFLGEKEIFDQSLLSQGRFISSFINFTYNLLGFAWFRKYLGYKELIERNFFSGVFCLLDWNINPGSIFIPGFAKPDRLKYREHPTGAKEWNNPDNLNFCCIDRLF